MKGTHTGVLVRGSVRTVVAACLVVGTIGWAAPQAAGPQAAASQAAARPQPAAAPLAAINRYCVTCHNQRTQTGGLSLDGLDAASIPAHAEVWEKVVRKLRTGAMPPQGVRRPDRATLRPADRVARSRRSTGPPRAPIRAPAALHRLNRAEYANAVRDLLALDVDVASLLPPDDSAYGFDNIADVLGVSPVLIERYLVAADGISALAVGDREASARLGDLPRPPGSVAGPAHRGPAARHRRRHAGPPHLPGRRRVRLPGEAVPHQLRRHARARAPAAARDHGRRPARLPGDRGRRRGLPACCSRTRRPRPTGVDEAPEGARAGHGGPARRSAPRSCSGADGGHAAAAAVLRSSVDTYDFTGRPHIDTLTLTGPFNATGVGRHAEPPAIFVCRPASRGRRGPLRAADPRRRWPAAPIAVR